MPLQKKLKKYTGFSIILPCYNAEKWMDNCLSSLQKQSYEGKFEILVVDDGSKDKTIEKAKKFKGVKVIRSKHVGLPGVKNLGAKNSRFPWLIFLDVDTIIPRNFLEKVNALIDKQGIDCFGAIDDPLKEDTYLGKSLRYQENFFRKYFFLFKNPILKIKGALMVIKKSSFSKVGGFDESRIYYAAEDTDLVQRMSKKGFKCDFFAEGMINHHCDELKNHVRKMKLGFNRSIRENYMGKTTYMHYLVYFATAIFLFALFVRPMVAVLMVLVALEAMALLALVISIMMKSIFYLPGIFVIILIQAIFLILKSYYYLFR